jgi:hypothetical protein
MPISGNIAMYVAYRHCKKDGWVSQNDLCMLVTVLPAYNVIGLCGTLYVASSILWPQLILHC